MRNCTCSITALDGNMEFQGVFMNGSEAIARE